MRVFLGFICICVLSAFACGDSWQPKDTFVFMATITHWAHPRLGDFERRNRQDRVLRDVFLSRGVPRHNLVYLEDARATKRRMYQEFKRLLRRTPENSTLIFYFQGHGIQFGRRNQVRFACADANPNIRSSAVNPNRLASLIRRNFSRGRVLLLGDSCYSGILSGVARSLESTTRLKVGVIASAHLLCPSSVDWTFTRSLVNVFSGKPIVDRNDDNRITFDEAEVYVRNEMGFWEEQLAETSRSIDFSQQFVLAPRDRNRRRVRIRNGYREGSFVDVKWEDGYWYIGRIERIRRNRVRIRMEDEFEEEHVIWAEWSSIRRPLYDRWSPGNRVVVHPFFEKARVLRGGRAHFYLIQYESSGKREWVSSLHLSRVRSR